MSSSIWCIPEPDCVVLMERERVQDGETLRSASSSFGRSLSSAAPGATIARYRARRRPQRGGSHRGAGNLPWAIPEPGRWRELERLLSDDAGPAAAPSTRWVVDPDQPATAYNSTDVEQGGIWKSFDQGSTWSKANSGLSASGGKIGEFFAALVPPYALYARVGDKVYRSTDRAKSWTVQSALPGTTGIYRIAFRSPSVQFYVRLGVVWRSAD